MNTNIEELYKKKYLKYKAKYLNIQKGGGTYNIETSDPKTRIPHLLTFLKLYDINSAASIPKLEYSIVYFSGIKADNGDVETAIAFLTQKYPGKEITKTDITSRNERMISVKSTSDVLTDTLDLFMILANSSNLSYKSNTNYSFNITTDAVDALRYYLTRNRSFPDLTKNGLKKLDDKPEQP